MSAGGTPGRRNFLSSEPRPLSPSHSLLILYFSLVSLSSLHTALFSFSLTRHSLYACAPVASCLRSNRHHPQWRPSPPRTNIPSPPNTLCTYPRPRRTATRLLHPRIPGPPRRVPVLNRSSPSTTASHPARPSIEPNPRDDSPPIERTRASPVLEASTGRIWGRPNIRTPSKLRRS